MLSPVPLARTRSLAAILLGATLLQGCVSERPLLDPPALPPAPEVRKPVGEVLGSGPQGVTEVPLPDNVFSSEPRHKSDPLPGFNIGRHDLEDANLWGWLTTMVPGTGITLTRQGDIGGRTVAAYNIGDSFDYVVTTLCRIGNVWCSYKGDPDGKKGELSLKERQVFSVPLPPVKENHDHILTAIKQYAPKSEPAVDKNALLLTYSATTAEQEEISAYLEQLDRNRVQIVFDIYIWEVILNDSRNSGISWDQFDINWGGATLSSSRGSATPPSTGVNWGFLYQGSDVAVNLLTNFLQEQGTISSIRQPRASLLNGTQAKFKDGGKEFFISEIGQPTNQSYLPVQPTQPTNPDGTPNGGTGNPGNPGNPYQQQLTVETDTLETGLSFEIFGQYHDGTVFADIKLENTQLIEFRKFPTGAFGGELNLPKTGNRDFTQMLRIQPGGVLLVAGLNSSSDNYTDEGPGGRITTRKERRHQRSEMVVALVPKIFIYKKQSEIAREAAEKAKAAEATPDQAQATAAEAPPQGAATPAAASGPASAKPIALTSK